MPRRIKSAPLPTETTKPPKKVAILLSQDAPLSAHILDLREKLNPPAAPPTWQPSTFDRVLSQPLPHFRFPRLPTFNLTRPRFRLPCLARRQSRQAKPKFNFPAFPRLSLPQIELPHFSFAFLTVQQKAIASFVLLCLIFILPLPALSTYADLRTSQTQIVSLGTEAFNHLQNSQTAFLADDLAKAGADLQSALNLFSQTQKELNEINPALRALLALIPGLRQQYLNAEHLMMAGTNLSLAALPLAQTLNSLSRDETPTDGLARLDLLLSQALPKFQAVCRHLNAVSPDALSPSQQPTFLAARQKMELLTADLEKIEPLLQTISALLGEREPKRYLLIFQNPNELRPTGGFIGSFALLDIFKGEIKKMDLPGGGSYELQGALKAAVLPPAPFQDANWFPDFPTSAKKIAWFYEKGGGPTVDGVIALDTAVLVDLLKIIGEIAMPEYGLTVNAENFVAETQKQVEIDYNKQLNKPKQFLADLSPKILERVFQNKENRWPLLGLLAKNLEQRHLQLYLSDSAMEQAILEQGWGGELKENPNGDFLMVVNTNIAGGKTDGVIRQTVNHQAKIEIDGSIVGKVTILREHQGQEGDLFTNLQNVDYLRLYVPLGSELLKAEGFIYPEEKHFKVAEPWYKIDEDLKKIEQNQTIDDQSGTVITQEFGKTSFGNWAMTKPGQTSLVSFTYKLPFKIKKENQKFLSYSLLIQKQAGSLASRFSSAVSFPPEWQVVWHDPPELTQQNNQISFSSELNEDKYFGLVMRSE